MPLRSVTLRENPLFSPAREPYVMAPPPAPGRPNAPAPMHTHVGVGPRTRQAHPPRLSYFGLLLPLPGPFLSQMLFLLSLLQGSAHMSARETGLPEPSLQNVERFANTAPSVTPEPNIECIYSHIYLFLYYCIPA